MIKFSIEFLVSDIFKRIAGWGLPVPKLTPAEAEAENVSEDNPNLPPDLSVRERRLKIVLRRLFGKEEINENDWNNLNWSEVEKPNNHPLHIGSRKPTWQEIVDAYYSSLLETDNYTEDEVQTRERISLNKKTKDLLADKPIDNIHVGAGLMHMSGLAHLVEDANMAGNSINHMMMRTEDGELAHIYTQADMRDILRKLAKRENSIESAHNAVMQKHQVLVNKSKDTSLSPKERYEARKDAYIMISRHDERLGEDISDKNYKANLEKEIAAYDPNAMPDSIEDQKKVYSERLEGIATKKLATIKKRRNPTWSGLTCFLFRSG